MNIPVTIDIEMFANLVRFAEQRNMLLRYAANSTYVGKKEVFSICGEDPALWTNDTGKNDD